MSDVSSHPLPSDRPIRVAVAGLGSAAQLLHLPVIAELPELELVGLCDQESYKVAMVSENLGVEGFVEVDALLETTEPDLLVICTPTHTHLPIALTALEHGAHVIVEKPATLTHDEALRLSAAARDHGRHVLVAMNQRFRQDISILGNYLEQGTLGDLWRVRGGWLKRIERWNHSPWLANPRISGGGAFIDLGLQLLDVILWQLGYPKLRRVSGFCHHEMLGLDVEDTATAMLEVENGPVIQIDCGWGLRAERDVSYTYVEGRHAAARLPGLTLIQAGEKGLEFDSRTRNIPQHDIYTQSFRTQHQQFIRALRGEIEPLSTIAEAGIVLEVVDQVYRSAREGRELVLTTASE